jgi:hypothetical protein
MRRGISAALLCACLIGLGWTGTATAADADGAVRETASWYTEKLHKKSLKRAGKGVHIAAEALNTECPGVQSPGIAAAGCIVSPAGCTANYIFTDGSSQYVGTARHCVNRIGEPVVMQVDTATVATVGTVSHMTSGEGEPGNDWALVRIDPAAAARWGVDPAVPVIGGPQGIYAGCGPTQALKYYGHGYGVAVGQGKPEFGVGTNWYDDGYGWTGFGAPGDSGSPVLTADTSQAVGNFTHLIVDLGAYPGSDHAGMRITEALARFNVSLVNADGSTAPRITDSSCPGDAPA